MCPQIALLDLELGNYTPGRGGERRGVVISGGGGDERWQFGSPKSQGWRKLQFTVSQQGAPGGINNRG